ncbi:MAG: RNA-binding S4 domain-containing protein [Chitinophagales bacterium]|nr:RNA-binding S4 domain-containing protein [Chitinophagales bacterium]
MDKLRIDKWLWAVRAFKTRSLATEACAAGKVKVDGNSVKAAYQLKVGETVSFSIGPIKKVWKVEKLIEKRVGAPDAQACYEDLSPPMPDNPEESAFYLFPKRERCEGRPTKKERRGMDKLRPKF